jgi:16S rRNA (guanine527-N7)-methyltransferase
MAMVLEDTDFWRQFTAHAEEMGVRLSLQQLEFFQNYAALLQQWNAKINLTTVSDVPGIIRQHFLDSFTLLPFLPTTGLLLDVGTGAGFPGVPLACLQADRLWWLVDSNSKKVRFIRHLAQQFELKNLAVQHYHLQGIKPEHWPCFEAVVSRAFASLADFAKVGLPLLCPYGRLLAMKGQYPEKELQAVRKVGKVVVMKVERLYIPHFPAARHLVILQHA